MFYCDQIKSVALTDYIIFPKYDDNDFENYDFTMLELVGRPVAVEAVKAMLQNSTRVGFTDNNNPETYFELYDNSFKVSVNKSSSLNQITTLVASKSEVLGDMFRAGDMVKFMEIIRKKSKIPLANEWAEGLLKILIEKRKIKKAISNIGEYYILSNVSKLNEVINEYIDSLFNNGEIKYEQTGIEIPTNISGFVSEYKNELSKMILDKCDVLYKGNESDKIDYTPVLSTFIPYGPQMDTANAISKLLSQPNENAAFLSAEMGCGKTLMSLLSVYGYYVRNNKKPLRILLMLPPHLLNKWERETKKVFGNLLSSIKTIKTITDINNLKEEFKTKSIRSGIEVYFVSRERAKLSYYWRHACIDQAAMKANKQRKTKKMAFKCPKCGLKQDGYESKRNKCVNEKCGEALWQATSQIQRMSLMEYMKKKLPQGYFDLFILDEAHEEKGNSARGVSAGQAVSMAKKAIFLTGTLSGGKPSTLHFLLWRTNPQGMKKVSEYNSPMMTSQKYGIIEEVRKSSESDNKMSKNNRVQTNIKEKPGISPEMLTDFFFDKTVFMKNEDLRADLPEYTEYVDIIPLTEEHKKEYDKFANVLRGIVNAYLAHGDMGMLSKMLVSLTAYADNPVLDEVRNREGKIVAVSEPLDIETNKEAKLVELVAENKAQGRKVLIYCEYTNIRDLQPRIKAKLEEYGYSAIILPAKVKPEKREQWITDNAKDFDVMICNPRLVSTGLDLYDFPTIVFYQTSYSVYLLRQASRRSWRIGQTKSVEVHFLTNQATIQETAMHLIADKMVSSQIFEGELPEGGLEELSQVEEKSFIKQLAESLNDNKDIMGSLEALWKNKMQKEVESDDFIEVEATQVVETAIQTVKTET
ncbi:MAG: helicase-related protein, partial [bacterium]